MRRQIHSLTRSSSAGGHHSGICRATYRLYPNFTLRWSVYHHDGPRTSNLAQVLRRPDQSHWGSTSLHHSIPPVHERRGREATSSIEGCSHCSGRAGTLAADHLPFGLLGIRSTLKEDILCTSAELVCGRTLHLPGDLRDTGTTLPVDFHSYVHGLRELFWRL